MCEHRNVWDGEEVCCLCGAVTETYAPPLALVVYGRAPMNHGVDGKNLGTPQTKVYAELKVRGLVSGAVKTWDLERINEPNPFLMEKIRVFTATMLRRGLKEEEVDPLAREYRAALSNIMQAVKEEAKRFEARLLREKVSKFDDAFLGLNARMMMTCRSQ